MMLEARNLSVRYGSLTILDNVSFAVGDKQWVMIVGPNGAGKSTVVNAVSRGAPYTGQILLDGKDIRKYKSTELARKIGVLAQDTPVGYSFSVEEVVGLGRYAYSGGMLSSKSSGDAEFVERALELTGLKELRRQSILTLSGGEKQRTFLAQVLAQDPELLILDEPTNHLDLVFQKQTFALIKNWIEETGRSVISVVHDLSLAKAYGTHALLMHRGRLVASGEIPDVLTRENLTSVYDMDVHDWMRKMLSQWEDGQSGNLPV
jgi:iron complex transport system ATP-binding protein